MAMGKNIRLLRTVRGWSHDTLGQKAGTSGQTILQLEKRDSTKSRYASRIADALDVPLGWLEAAELETQSDAEEMLGILSALMQRTSGPELEYQRSAVVDYVFRMVQALLRKDSTLDDQAEMKRLVESAFSRVPYTVAHDKYDNVYIPERGINRTQQHTPQAEQNVLRAPIGTRRIPVLSYVQAGEMTEAGCVDMSEVYGDYVTTDLELSEHAFALEIKGDSMVAPPGSGEESFNEGDRIIVDCNVTPLPGDFVVAKNGEHEATFKKYRPRGLDENNREVFELVPLNPDYPTLRNDRQHIEIIGVMVEHRRYRKRR